MPHRLRLRRQACPTLEDTGARSSVILPAVWARHTYTKVSTNTIIQWITSRGAGLIHAVARTLVSLPPTADLLQEIRKMTSLSKRMKRKSTILKAAAAAAVLTGIGAAV